MPNDNSDKLNTGSPGFELPEVGEPNKSYTYDVGDPDSPGVVINTDKGNMTVEGDDAPKKDISKPTRMVLAAYLGKKTSQNYYPVDGFLPPEPGETYKTTVLGSDGKQKTPIVGDISNTQHFPKPSVQEGVEPTYAGTTETSPELRKWRNSSPNDQANYDPPKTTLIGLVKGKSISGGNIDGNQLLSQVKKNDLGKMENYTIGVLKNNRFTGLSTTIGRDRFAPFMSPNGEDASIKKIGMVTDNEENINSTLNNFNPKIYNPKYKNFNYRKMAKVGVALSTRSSLELGSTTSGYNPTSFSSEISSIIPSTNQIGIASIDTVNLTAESVLQDLIEKEFNNEINYVNTNTKSWGNLNNVYDQYQGLTALGMTALSLLSIAAMLVIFEVISLIVGSGPNVVYSANGRGFSGKYALHVDSGGDFGNFQIQSFLGLRPTLNPYKKAIKAGIDAYFGVEGGIVKIFNDSYSSPGYRNVIARAVIRSIANIVNAISNIGGNSISDVIALIQTIRDSKLISAMTIFASLGDQLLNDKGAENLDKSKSGEPVRKSRIDKIGDDVIGSSTSKSRLNQGQNVKLAWSSDRAHSLYLIPNSIGVLQPVMSNYGAHQLTTITDNNSRTRYRFNNERIPYDYDSETVDSVEGMENLIDATDHVPFYFHDIRTNEIISFHAFLESFSDSFSANYDSVDGFGRVEPVKIYKGTTRKFDISFHVVSTSRRDFDEMWMKLNKLVTMVYPQYTEGRWLEDKDKKYKFTQPFSQMIGASPMIRLRLGNLISTNYSKYALARLFGATLDGAKFDEKIMPEVAVKEVYKQYQEVISKYFDITATTIPKGRAVERKREFDAGFTPIETSFAAPVSGESENADWIVKSGIASYYGEGKHARNFVVDEYTKFIPAIKVWSDKSTGRAQVKFTMPTAKFLWEQGIQNVSQQTKLIDYIDQVYNDPNNPSRYYIDGSYELHKHQLELTEGTKQFLYTKTVMNIMESESETFGDFVNSFQDFLDPEKNALVKSFKSTAGKGLAGFIDNLSFDWGNTSARWEVDSDARAPQMCKVTLSFTPIHDISPGLDSQGYNRAPVYPVGPYSTQRRKL